MNFCGPTPPMALFSPTPKFHGPMPPTPKFDPHHPCHPLTYATHATHPPMLLAPPTLFSILFQLSNDSSCAFVIVISITFISTKLACFLILKLPEILKRRQFLTSLLNTKVFFNIKKEQ